jgi:ABC-2 type transport system ATP-binding protein
MSDEPAIALHGLTKRFGDRAAVDALSAEIPHGAVAGVIGPNGAGKTTMMAMLLGLVRPTAGEGRVLGESIRSPERYAGRVGALLEGPALWPGLTGTENLRVLAKLGRHDERAIPQLLALVGLADRADDRFGRYSLGMKQRLGIAAALLGSPELIVLDEPTNGLDPAGIREMRQLIATIAQEARTVLISSHILSEIEHVCDWLMVIDGGRALYTGPATEFAGHMATRVTLAPLDREDLPALAEVIGRRRLTYEHESDRLSVQLDGGDPRTEVAILNRASIDAGIDLVDVHIEPPTLETAYLDRVRATS